MRRAPYWTSEQSAIRRFDGGTASRTHVVEQVDVAARAAAIEYAIRDVVIPAVELEAQGH